MPHTHELSLWHWIALSAFFHVTLLGINLSKRKLSQAVIPVEFFYTAPTPPVNRPVVEPAPKKPQPVAPPKKAKEKAIPQKKVEVAKPVAKKEPVKAETKKTAETGSAEEVKKSAAPQPTSRIVMTRQAFPFSYYARIIQQKVWREWDWSAATGQRKAVVSFQILKNGNLGSSRLETPSGEGLFDQAALRAVQVAAPFPPLPEAYQEEALDVFFEFNFQE